MVGDVNDPPNRVRSEPTLGDNQVGEIYPGWIVKVIDGPVCVDNLVFWKIENDAIPGGVGWTAEGSGQEYWIAKSEEIPPSTTLAAATIDPTPKFLTLSAYGVSFSVPISWSDIPYAEIIITGGNGYCTWPEHTKITLSTYLAQSEWEPVIYVYETEHDPDWYPICPGAPLLMVNRETLSHGECLLFGSKNAQPIFNSE